MDMSSNDDNMMAAVAMLFEGDLKSAYPYLKKASDNNVPDACYYLGKMYFFGNYVQRSKNHAFYLMKKAAEQDHNEAQYLLSYFYKRGFGVFLLIVHYFGLLNQPGAATLLLQYNWHVGIWELPVFARIII